MHRFANGRRIEFEQLIGGIPVERRNFVTVSAFGKIIEINIRLVDAAPAAAADLLSADAAVAHAIEALETHLGKALEEVEIIKATTLSYHADSVRQVLVPLYELAIHTTADGNWRVTVNARSGESAVFDPRQYADLFGYRIACVVTFRLSSIRKRAARPARK